MNTSSFFLTSSMPILTASSSRSANSMQSTMELI
uniref:Uncharacterized protein n=1 Tax=Arundo donax TaxID=35708 RepID=A0A0A9FQH8_ARUDO